MKQIKNFGAVFWIHLALILIAYASPILFRWQIVLADAIILYIQQITLNGCVLTHAQFGKDKNMTFYYHYLKLLGIKTNKVKLKMFMTWAMPAIVVAVAALIQIALEIKPLVY